MLALLGSDEYIMQYLRHVWILWLVFVLAINRLADANLNHYRH